MNVGDKKYMALKILRIVFPIWLTFFLFVGTIFFVFVPTLKKNMLKQKKETIRDLVDSSCGILSEYQRQVERGDLKSSDAKLQAINHIRNFRYGKEGKDYFWIIDMHPFMVMHPYRPDLESRDLTLFEDAQGNYPFLAMVEVVLRNGSGYVDYFWQWKDAPERIVPKISYVRGFPPWGWILGTGIYTEDVKSEVDAILANLSIISITILFIILGISFYLTLQTIRIENERFLSADQLRKSEQLHRKFIDDAPIGMFTVNLEGEFTYINKKLELITGYRKEKWLGKSFYPIVHPDDLSIVENKRMLRLSGKGSTDPYEIRIFNSDRDVMWIKIHSESISSEGGEAKELIGMQSFVEDITFKKEAETSLKFSENRLKAILEANPDPMVVYDLVGHPEYLNPAFTNVFGWTLDELKNKKIPFVPEDQKARSLNKIKEIYKHGDPLSFETKRYTKTGQCLEILLSAAVNKNDDGVPIGMVVNLTDITEQKALESKYKQAQKMEAIGTLTGGIAHDFNNILSIILGHTELGLCKSSEKDPAHTDFIKIQKAGLRGASIIRQLLKFSRKSKQEHEASKLSVITRDSLKLLRSLIPSNVEIKENFLAENDTIMADPVQINQILMNLCINASQEMEINGGILEIGIENEQAKESISGKHSDLQKGYCVKLTVSDTGPGIPPELIDRIFDPYFTTKEFGKGSGMGLSVVHGIVRSHNGDITVSSEPGKGTTFTIRFPVTDKKIQIEGDENKATLPGKEKILFIDDDKAIAEMAKESLQGIGYHVETKSDPLQAVEMFKLEPEYFDLILTDMTMPGMTGDKLSEIFLKIRPDIPIIICTGYSSIFSAEDAKRIGVKRYLTKPVSISTLSQTVREVLTG